MGIGSALLRRDRRRPLVAPLPPAPAPDQREPSRSEGSRERVEIARDRWGMPTVRARSAADLWFGQGYLPRPGPPLADRDPAPHLLGPRLRDRGARRSPGRPPDAHPGPPPRRSARGGRARRRPALPARCLLRGPQRGRPHRPRAPAGVSAAAPRLRAVAARRHARRRQAPLLRALDQLGAGAAARRPGSRARRGARREDRPHVSEGQSGRAPARSRLRRRRPAASPSRSGGSATRSAWPRLPAAPTTGP